MVEEARGGVYWPELLERLAGAVAVQCRIKAAWWPRELGERGEMERRGRRLMGRGRGMIKTRH